MKDQLRAPFVERPVISLLSIKSQQKYVSLVIYQVLIRSVKLSQNICVKVLYKSINEKLLLWSILHIGQYSNIRLKNDFYNVFKAFIEDGL